MDGPAVPSRRTRDAGATRGERQEVHPRARGVDFGLQGRRLRRVAQQRFGVGVEVAPHHDPSLGPHRHRSVGIDCGAGPRTSIAGVHHRRPIGREHRRCVGPLVVGESPGVEPGGGVHRPDVAPPIGERKCRPHTIGRQRRMLVVHPCRSGGSVGEVEHLAGAQRQRHDERLAGEPRRRGVEHGRAIGGDPRLPVRSGVTVAEAVAPILGVGIGEAFHRAIATTSEQLLGDVDLVVLGGAGRVQLIEGEVSASLRSRRRRRVGSGGYSAEVGSGREDHVVVAPPASDQHLVARRQRQLVLVDEVGRGAHHPGRLVAALHHQQRPSKRLGRRWRERSGRRSGTDRRPVEPVDGQIGALQHHPGVTPIRAD